MNNNIISDRNFDFLNSDNETFFEKCFKLYILGEDYVNLSNEEVEKNIIDLNDYKIVASISYLILAKVKLSKPDFVQYLKDGLERISRKPVSPTYNIIFDEMALMGLILVAKNLNLQKYYEWLKKLLFEYKKSATIRGNDYGFAELMEEYINDTNIAAGIQSDKSILIKSWLLYEKKQENSCLIEQCELSKKIWKKGIPYFNDYFFDCLACGVIDKLIAKKFEFGIISIESNYKRAIKAAEKLGKFYATLLSFIILVVVIVLWILIAYKICDYEHISDKNLWYVPAFVSIVGIITIPLALIKSIKKIYLNLANFFSLLVKKIRQLV